MAGSINKVILVGNVGKDPEIRSLNEIKVANFSLATSETWKDKHTGERRERTEWHRIVVWGKLAGIVEKYVSKGAKLYIEGQLKTRKWQDQAGNDRYSTEVVLQGFNGSLVMLDGRSGGGSGDQGGGYGADEPGSDPACGGGGFDDEIPF